MFLVTSQRAYFCLYGMLTPSVNPLRLHQLQSKNRKTEVKHCVARILPFPSVAFMWTNSRPDGLLAHTHTATERGLLLQLRTAASSARDDLSELLDRPRARGSSWTRVYAAFLPSRSSVRLPDIRGEFGVAVSVILVQVSFNVKHERSLQPSGLSCCDAAVTMSAIQVVDVGRGKRVTE